MQPKCAHSQVFLISTLRPIPTLGPTLGPTFGTRPEQTSKHWRGAWVTTWRKSRCRCFEIRLLLRDIRYLCISTKISRQASSFVKGMVGLWFTTYCIYIYAILVLENWSRKQIMITLLLWIKQYTYEFHSNITYLTTTTDDTDLNCSNSKQIWSQTNKNK